MATPPRKLYDQVVHCIRGRVNFATSGIAAGVEIGVIPAGSFVESPIVSVETAFNAATTNVLQVGVAGTLAGFASGTDTASGSTGYKTGTGALRGNVTADTPVLVSYTQTGTAATTGVADILVRYYPHAS